MASDLIPLIDTASTLSVFSRPGEDIRLINSNSDSIFTFGDFRVYSNNVNEPLTSDTQSIRFDSFSTLDTLKTADFTPPKPYSVAPNELNLVASDPFSYAYFGSFYTEVANSINDILSYFPYAILANDNNTGITIYDYTASYNSITGEKSATFKVPYSALTNQGGVVVNSATTVDQLALVTNFEKFSIQMSAITSSAQTKTIDIIGYSFSSNTISYLEFSTNDFLDNISGTTSTWPIYIRPTQQRLAEYTMGLSELQYNMLYGFKMNVIDVVDDITETEQEFLWPKTIDGFNPDNYGSYFNSFKENILKAAESTDEAKTNILIKTVIPENYLELDSQQQIYASLTQTYAHQFDEIKRYIDGIAYAHTITYNKNENVPDKFIKKLSTLLGWKLSDKFNELDLFEYLAGDADGEGNSYSHFNLEIWRRILININWLYKKKGTRDALQFIFKLIGAPDCLLKLDEFVYQITPTEYISDTNAQEDGTIKINENGYINYQNSLYIFQEGGPGRGDGNRYIDQWKPEFNPILQVDNTKIVIGDESVFGSQNIVNTKEISIGLDPAQAIECDVFDFYMQSGTCWVWGSFVPSFSSLTIPFEYSIDDCNAVQPENIGSMSFSQYLEHIYSTSINPRDRKVIGRSNTSFFYPQLKNAYLNYYFWSNPQSSRLTFHKLQPILDLIEGNFTTYVEQLIPATTIFDGQGTIIRNTIFNRQKFVYKTGINDGSEFKTRLSNYESNLTPVALTTSLNEQLKLNLNTISITSSVSTIIKASLVYTSFNGSINSNSISTNINGYDISSTINDSGTITNNQPTPNVNLL